MTRLTGPPPGTAADWARRSLPLATALLIVAMAGGGCGSSQAEPDVAPEPGTVQLGPGDPEPDLTCTSDERAMGNSYIAEDAKGARTARAAVTEFAAGESAVVSAGGFRAWVLREDGTAATRLGLVQIDGWFVNETLSC